MHTPVCTCVNNMCLHIRQLRPHKHAVAPCGAILITPFPACESAFSSGSKIPMCWLCIPLHLIIIRVATLPRTLWTGPRTQHTGIDAIRCPPRSCVARSFQAREIVSKKLNPNDVIEATLDNWQPVWNAQVSISPPVCVDFKLRPGSDDIHICWFNFDVLTQGNAYKPTKELNR